MLNGPELGSALEAAIKLKGVSKADVARHFGVKPPSVQDWIKYGRIGKQHLTGLVQYFSDVAGPEHWGISRSEYAIFQDGSDGVGPSAAAIITLIRQLDGTGRLSQALADAVLAMLRTAPSINGRAVGPPPHKTAGVLQKHTADEVFQAQAIKDNKDMITEQTSGHIKKIRGVKRPPRKQDDSGQEAKNK